MNIADKRKAGEKLGRKGISQRILLLAQDIVDKGNYKNAVEKGGQISVLIQAATYDKYWTEKANIGIRKEEYLFMDLGEWITIENATKNVNPYISVEEQAK